MKSSASDSLRAPLGNLAPDKSRLGIGRGPPSDVEALWNTFVPERVPTLARKGREGAERSGEETQAARPRSSPPAAGRGAPAPAEAPSAALWFSICAALKRARRKNGQTARNN